MIANDLDTLTRIDALFDHKTAPQQLVDALVDPNWQIVQAALQAIGERRIPEAIDAITEVLEFQDQLDLYGAPEQWNLDGTDDPELADLWRCRFRVKQAACWALGEIGEPRGVDAFPIETIQMLADYTISADDDYCVRAAACQALGKMKAAPAVDYLQSATDDGEWCTATEAKKALAHIGPVEFELEDEVDTTVEDGPDGNDETADLRPGVDEPPDTVAMD